MPAGVLALAIHTTVTHTTPFRPPGSRPAPGRLPAGDDRGPPSATPATSATPVWPPSATGWRQPASASSPAGSSRARCALSHNRCVCAAPAARAGTPPRPCGVQQARSPTPAPAGAPPGRGARSERHACHSPSGSGGPARARMERGVSSAVLVRCAVPCPCAHGARFGVTLHQMHDIALPVRAWSEAPLPPFPGRSRLLPRTGSQRQRTFVT